MSPVTRRIFEIGSLPALLILQAKLLFYGFGHYGAHPDELGWRIFDILPWNSWTPFNFYYPTSHIYFLKILGVAILDPLHYKLGWLASYDIRIFNQLGQIVTSLMTLGITSLTYVIARQAGYVRNRAWLFAAFLATFPLLINLGRFNTTDVPNLFWIFLSIAFGMRVCHEPKAKWIVLSGLVCGLAAGVKYLAALFFPGIAVALYISLLKHDSRTPAHGKFVLWLVCISVGFLLGTPYVLIEPVRFWMDLKFISDRVPVWDGTAGPIGAIGIPLQALSVLSPLVIALSLVGVIFAITRYRKPLNIIVLSSPVIVFLFLARNYFYPLRFVLPLYAMLIMLAGIGASALLDWAEIKQKRFAPIICLIVIGIALLSQLRTSVAITYNFVYETRYVAAQWITKHLSEGKRVALPVSIYTYFPVPFLQPEQIYDTATAQRTEARWDVPQTVTFALTSSMWKPDQVTTSTQFQDWVRSEWIPEKLFSAKQVWGAGIGPTEFLSPDITVYRRPPNSTSGVAH